MSIDGDGLGWLRAPAVDAMRKAEQAEAYLRRVLPSEQVEEAMVEARRRYMTGPVDLPDAIYQVAAERRNLGVDSQG